MTLQDLMDFAGITFPLAKPKTFFITVPEYIYSQLAKEAWQNLQSAILISQSFADECGPETVVIQGSNGRRYKISPGNCLTIEPAQP